MVHHIDRTMRISEGSMSDTRFFGFWIIVRDETSAKEAIKMSGLPVLVMAANLMLITLIQSVQINPNYRVLMVLTILGCLLGGMAFRIRAGHSGWIPIVLVLFAIFIAGKAYSTAMQWSLSALMQVFKLQIMSSWIVPLFCAALVSAGLKGWIWQRKHGLRISF